MGKKKWLSLQQTVWIALGLGLGLVFGLIMPEFFYTPLYVILENDDFPFGVL